MNKEFPFHRWFRKHVGPWRMMFFFLLAGAFAILGPKYMSHQIGMTISLVALSIVMAGGIIMVAWQIYWAIKYPPHVEFCKECGRAKPIKYEE